MNQNKIEEYKQSANVLKDLLITVTGLANPPLGVILGICNNLGNYRSNEKVARMNFVMEKFIDLIKDKKSEEEFINDISQGKVEQIFMDFLETTLRKVSLINSEDKRKRFAYLLDNAYRLQENNLLFDNLDMFSDILEKTSDYQLQILIAHYDKNTELKTKLKLENESLYKSNLNYLMSMELLVSELNFYQICGGYEEIIADLKCSELSNIFIKFIKEYEK